MMQRRSALAFLLLLSACGYRPKKPLAPPRVTITGLRRQSGQWLIKLRLQNLVDADMWLDYVELQLDIAGQQLPVQVGPPMNILSALATDVVEQPVAISESQSAALKTATANGGSAEYSLQGKAWTSEPKRHFKIEQQGFLSAVPGREDEYR